MSVLYRRGASGRLETRLVLALVNRHVISSRDLVTTLSMRISDRTRCTRQPTTAVGMPTGLLIQKVLFGIWNLEFGIWDLGSGIGDLGLGT